MSTRVKPCDCMVASGIPSGTQPAINSSMLWRSGLGGGLRRGVGMGAGDCGSRHCRLDDATRKPAQFALRDTIGTSITFSIDIIGLFTPSDCYGGAPRGERPAAVG